MLNQRGDDDNSWRAEMAIGRAGRAVRSMRFGVSKMFERRFGWRKAGVAADASRGHRAQRRGMNRRHRLGRSSVAVYRHVYTPRRVSSL